MPDILIRDHIFPVNHGILLNRTSNFLTFHVAPLHLQIVVESMNTPVLNVEGTVLTQILSCGMYPWHYISPYRKKWRGHTLNHYQAKISVKK